MMYPMRNTNKVGKIIVSNSPLVRKALLEKTLKEMIAIEETSPELITDYKQQLDKLDREILTERLRMNELRRIDRENKKQLEIEVEEQKQQEAHEKEMIEEWRQQCWEEDKERDFYESLQKN